MFCRLALLTLAVVMLVPAIGSAAGGHDSISCEGCHGIHTAQDVFIFAVAENSTVAKGGKLDKISGLCLACHATSEDGGMGILPISRHMSHPFGTTQIDGKKASVPETLLRDGAFSCVSCHDPHMSNTNYKYLRVSTNGGAEKTRFCALCHASKVDPGTATASIKIFDSMNEAAFAAGAR